MFADSPTMIFLAEGPTFQWFDRFMPPSRAPLSVHGMSELVQPSSTLVDTDRFASLLISWIAPAAALVAVALGLFLIVQPYPGTGNFLPFAIFALGLGALAVCVSISREGYRSETTVPARSTTAAPIPSPGPAVVKGVSPAQRRLGESIGRGSGSEWRVLSDPLSPGDETWLGWLPRERRRLGAEAATLASGVVRSPGRAGNLVAFPVRDYYGTVPNRRGLAPRADAWVASAARRTAQSANRRSTVPAVPLGPIGEWPSGSGRASPYSVEELDRMFPPVSNERPLFLSEAPQRVGRAGRARDEFVSESYPPNPSEPIEPPAGMPDSQGDGTGSAREVNAVLATDRALDSQLLELSLEAANPIPPHLRTSGPIDRFDGAPVGRRRHGSSVARSVCASCSKVVMNLHMSGPCPKCLRPVCDECLRESFVTQRRGWCLDCSAPASTAS